MSLSPHFNKTLLATVLSLALSSPSYSSLVRNDISYQYFRDFAENKGQFVPNAQNIPIYNQSGQYVGTMMQNIPMPDFSAVNRNSGIATLVDPQYVTSVKHNVGYQNVEFGSPGSHNDAHHFSYHIVDRNNHPTFDYHAPRLHKLVTETAPFPLSPITERADGKINSAPYLDHQRFPLFVRVGSGTQGIRDEQRNPTRLSGAYQYLTGGGTVNLAPTQTHSTLLFFRGDIFGNSNGPMTTYGMPGDSGSPLFVFDKQQNKWVVAGVQSVFSGEKGDLNGYAITQPNFIRQSKQDDEIQFTNRSPNATFHWSATSGVSTLVENNGQQRLTIDIPHTTQTANDLARGKTLHISGQSGTLVLNDTIHQGAGALYFNQDFTVKPQSDQMWIGAGISVAENKQVNWQVSNPKNDRLSKIGAGTLYVNGMGKNEGDISIGEGKVILAQRADSQGQQQAFERVGIVSGRATVVLNDANQVRSNNIYFGYRGGRLDLNGNNITFSRIQNVDEGANIVNHNTTQTASVTITGGKPLSAESIEWVSWGEQPKTALALYEYINPWRNNRSDYFRLKAGQSPNNYFPTNAASNHAWEYLGNNKRNVTQSVLNEYIRQHQVSPFTQSDIEWGQWAKSPLGEITVYEYVNNHRSNRLDYFLLKPGGDPSTYFPLDQNSNSAWEYIGNNRQQAVEEALKRANNRRSIDTPFNTAFNGYFGEQDKSKPNGKLNVIYDTDDSTTHLISGGTNINGKFNILGGTVLLSGKPEPKARQYIDGNFKETFSHTQWLNRSFKATSTHLENNARLYIGRNVQQVTGNFHLQDNATLHIGFVQDETPVCIRSDYENRLTCQHNVQLPQNVLDSIPTTNINGDINLLHNSRFTLGKAHYLSTIQAKDKAEVRLTPHSRWTMWENSNLIHLAMDNARLTLNPAFDGSNSRSTINSYRTLTVNGNLSGNGRFDFLTNLAEAQTDKLIVNGIATGQYQLGIKNTGAEPKVIQSPNLVELRNARQNKYQVKFGLENGYVDLGAYRYILRNQHNRYHLYSPLREAQEENPHNPQALQEAQNQLSQANQDITRLDRETKRLSAEKQQSAQQLNKAERDSRNNAYFMYFGRRIIISPNNHTKQQLKQAQQRFNQKSEELRIALANLAQAKREAQAAQHALEAAQHQSVSAQVLEQAQRLCLNAGQTENICRSIALVSAENSPEMQRLANAQAEVDRLISEQEEAKQQLAQAEAIQQDTTQAVNSEQNITTATETDTSTTERSITNLNDNTEIREPQQAAAPEQPLATVAEAEADTSNADQPIVNLDGSTEIRELQQAVSAEAKSTETADIPPPQLSQAEGISRYSNLALSDLTAQTNMLLRIGHQFDRHLLTYNESPSSVWVNGEAQNARFQSSNYRTFRQESNLVQLGAATALNDALQIGALLSQSRANNRFEQGSGRSDLTLFGGYLKAQSANGLLATLDLNLGQANNRVDLDGRQARFHRHIYSVGLNLAKQWDLASFRLQPSIGARYHRLSSVNYELNQAQIAIKSISLPSYQLGIKIDKTFELNGIYLSPSFASYYVNTPRKTLAADTVKVNQHSLRQQFGRYLSHELGLNVKFNQWEIATHLNYIKGNEIGKQAAVSLKVGYQW
ncbi:autotransporter domain-containing protein [Muribacter muris]|nr:autotransporter domain-containing protein [Muribacter muris]